MKIEQALISQLMILLNIKNGKTRPSEISKDLDITIQGVVYHMKILKARGFIDDGHKITKEGFDFLYNGLNYMENFVHSSLISIDSSLVWEVIPDEDFDANEDVALYMKRGYLHAKTYTGNGAHGITIRSAVKGKCTGVTGVREIINIKKSGVVLLVVNNVEKIDNMENLSQLVKDTLANMNFDFLGIIGEIAKNITDLLNIKPQFEYATINSAFEAARRGFTTAIVVSERFFHFSLPEIRELQSKNAGIELDLRHI